jgi:hypothetical protein
VPLFFVWAILDPQLSSPQFGDAGHQGIHEWTLMIAGRIASWQAERLWLCATQRRSVVFPRWLASFLKFTPPTVALPYVDRADAHVLILN